MIKLFASILDSVVILRQFLAHYQALGVEGFYFNMYEAFDPLVPDRAQRILDDFGAVGMRVTGPHDWVRQNELRNELQRANVANDDWALLADLDEFHEYPRGLAQTLRDAEALGYDCVWGHMIDHVAPGGELVALDEHAPVFEQFPIQCHVTRDILKAPDWKIVAMRSHVLPPSSCVPDRVMRDKYGASPATHFGVVIHHFKWHAAVVEKLRRRLELYERQYATGDVRFACYKESANFLAHLREHGRVRLDAPCAPILPTNPFSTA